MNRNILIAVLALIVFGSFAVMAFGPMAGPDNNNDSERGEVFNTENDMDRDPGEYSNGDPGTDLETGDDEGDSMASEMEGFILCLKDAGVVIYGSVTCPYCTQLVEAFGGYEVVEPIYVECSQEGQRCQSEMIGRGVPEIQISGEMYRGSRNPQDIGRAVGCVIGS